VPRSPRRGIIRGTKCRSTEGAAWGPMSFRRAPMNSMCMVYPVSGILVMRRSLHAQHRRHRRGGLLGPMRPHRARGVPRAYQSRQRPAPRPERGCTGFSEVCGSRSRTGPVVPCRNQHALTRGPGPRRRPRRGHPEHPHADPHASIDTREITAETSAGASRVDEKFAELAEWIQQSRAPISPGLVAHVLPKLATSKAGTLQFEQGQKASTFAKQTAR
jgi:hypothetical protein